jgi:uncharacterized protein YycO
MAEVWLRFVTEPGFTSNVIRWFSWSEWSHIDFALSNGKFLGARLEDGVQVRNHDYLTPSKFCYAKVEVYGTNRRVLGWATSQIGKPYDWTAILGFGFRRNWHDPQHWFCSELVAEAFKLKDSVLVDNSAYRITPQTLFESVRVEKEAINTVPPWVKDLGYATS